MKTMPSTATIRFAADADLGRLAQHLRMLGLDTYWETGAEASEVLERASREGRVLLTRDEALFERAKPEARHRVLAKGAGPELREVVLAHGLGERARAGEGFFTLCMNCGSTLLPVKGHQVHDRIPGRTLLASTDFFLCSRCERVYSKDAFHARMRKWVAGLFA